MINKHLKKQSESIKLIDCIQYYIECMQDNQKTWADEWLEIINYKLSFHPNNPTLFEYLKKLENNSKRAERRKWLRNNPNASAAETLEAKRIAEKEMRK